MCSIREPASLALANASVNVRADRRKKSANTSASHDYFLAEGSLTWWAIGASLIASNISAEQFIGMSGSGFRIGMAIAVYELMAAATLVIVAVFFMPVYLKNHIYTMPQFLEQRYGKAVATTMALFWLGLYVVVNLTSILYLGALAIGSVTGIGVLPCMLFLAVFAAIITLGGGRSRPEDGVDHAVGLTEVLGLGEACDGRPLAVIHARDERSWAAAAEMVRSAFVIGERAEPPALIRERIVGRDLAPA